MAVEKTAANDAQPNTIAAPNAVEPNNGAAGSPGQPNLQADDKRKLDAEFQANWNRAREAERRKSQEALAAELMAAGHELVDGDPEKTLKEILKSQKSAGDQTKQVADDAAKKIAAATARAERAEARLQEFTARTHLESALTAETNFIGETVEEQLRTRAAFTELFLTRYQITVDARGTVKIKNLTGKDAGELVRGDRMEELTINEVVDRFKSEQPYFLKATARASSGIAGTQAGTPAATGGMNDLIRNSARRG